MVEVISAGIFSTIQDQGRFGYRNIGVPVSGAMDRNNSDFANALLNNDYKCAVLESTIIGPSLLFHQDTFIAVTGAECDLKLNHQSVCINKVIYIKKGDILSFGKVNTGVRNYLAVAGGWQTPVVLGSRSYYPEITNELQIHSGDRLLISLQVDKIINRTTVKFNSSQVKNNVLQVTIGPEFNLLDNRSRHNLISQSFKVSPQSNRMAYKLNHGTKLAAKEIITSSVQPGTVQLTPSGELIVLMRDCQTTGGYARVLQLTENAINHLAQKSAGKKVLFSINRVN